MPVMHPLPDPPPAAELYARTDRSIVSEHAPGTQLPVHLVALPDGWREVSPAVVERVNDEVEGESA